MGAAETGESGNGGKRGRPAAGGKVLNGRAERHEHAAGRGDDERKGGGQGNRDGRGMHLAVGKEGDGALVVGSAGVGMDPFVERRGGGHGVEQQHSCDQNQGNDCLAAGGGLALIDPHKMQSSRGAAGRKWAAVFFYGWPGPRATLGFALGAAAFIFRGR